MCKAIPLLYKLHSAIANFLLLNTESVYIMGLFKITVKQNKYSNGVNLEKGMFVEVASKYSNPLTTNGGHEVVDGFMRKYGIDIKKNGGGSVSGLLAYLTVEKIN